MQLMDALFNWLQIKVVWDARPADRSAKDTVEFFAQMLREDHGVEVTGVTLEGDHYLVRFEKDGQTSEQRFEREAVEQLLSFIESEPKFNQ
ncbi:hypothetical protein JQC72_02570 [Polycladomyces sp. WAk]|jgi:hypothetical protein|uniref:Uncharacterized protein n=1 Tax=Polycladomyces zharkentensis TaxID=2807616 RepID=A0ABS2WG15_9BACL|nr:hypothetical protein [Polycladomyces sp. WAk]MBN2908406.1 hypothetical protein [Polycladomyces sp. WAk]